MRRLHVGDTIRCHTTQDLKEYADMLVREGYGIEREGYKITITKEKDDERSDDTGRV